VAFADSPPLLAGQSSSAWQDSPPVPGSLVPCSIPPSFLLCFRVCFKESFLRLEVDP
jgi:hypothetical protein